LAKKDNLKITGTLSLPQGEAIISLAAFGDVIYASTNNRRLYRVLPGELPLNSYAVVIESIIDGASDNIENLQTSGDHIYFNIGTSVHRLDLNTYVDSVIELPESAAINALHYANSNLWVAHRTSTSSEVRVIDAASWTIIDSIRLSFDQLVTDLAEDHGYLAVGLGDSGLQIIDLNGQARSVNPALASPAIGTVCVQGYIMHLTLSDTKNINSVRFYANDILLGGTAQFPFDLYALVPPNLRNGQPFNLTVEVETFTGQVLRSSARKVALQGEDLPGNPFSVVIVHPQPGVPTYVPKPLELRAEVKNSSQPIHQVEYYEADALEGPYKIIGKHYGPEFVIYRAYNVEDSGKYLKVRAVDAFGNLTESSPLQFTRLQDDQPPVVRSFDLRGSVLPGNQ